jgi:hypothetical protein
MVHRKIVGVSESPFHARQEGTTNSAPIQAPTSRFLELGCTIGTGSDLVGYFAALATRIIRKNNSSLSLEAVDFFSVRVAAVAELNRNPVGFGSCGYNLLTDIAFVHLLSAIEHLFEAATLESLQTF